MRLVQYFFIISFFGILLPAISNAANTTSVGTLSLAATYESISVYANFSDDIQSDLNADGLVNTIDFSLMNQNWLRTAK